MNNDHSFLTSLFNKQTTPVRRGLALLKICVGLILCAPSLAMAYTVLVSPNPTSESESTANFVFTVTVSNPSSAGTSPTLTALSDSTYGDITQVQGNITATTCSVPQTTFPYSCNFTGTFSATPPASQTDTLTATGIVTSCVQFPVGGSICIPEPDTGTGSTTVSLTLKDPLLQTTLSLSAMLQSSKTVTGKNNGAPAPVPLDTIKYITLTTQNIINLAQGLAANAKPVPGVVLALDCSTDELFVVSKAASNKPVNPAPATSTVTVLVANPVGVLSQRTESLTLNGGLNGGAASSVKEFGDDESLFTPSGKNATSTANTSDVIGLAEIKSLSLGVASDSNLVMAFKATAYAGDPAKADILSSQNCPLSIAGTDIVGAAFANLGGLAPSQLTILKGTLSVGRTFVGYK